MVKRQFQTTKKMSGTSKTYRKWEEWQVGEIVIGKFVETHTDQYKKECPVLEIVDSQLKDEKLNKDLIGKNLVLNHCGMVGKAFEKISEGQLVQITYQGTSVIEKGPYAGKESHVVGVDLVEEVSDADPGLDL